MLDPLKIQKDVKTVDDDTLALFPLQILPIKWSFKSWAKELKYMRSHWFNMRKKQDQCLRIRYLSNFVRSVFSMGNFYSSRI